MITILSGGTGTPKLLQGIMELVEPEKFRVIVNTVENSYFSGVYVAADIDTVMYTLAGIINNDTWYGIKDDTFITHETLKEIKCPETLKIGDRDRAIKIQKTLLMEQYSLSRVVDIQRKSLGIESQIIPMSNGKSNITIETNQGKMDFHKFLVEKQGMPEVIDIKYDPVSPTPGLIELIEDSDMIIIGPSNPITSIGPIINLKGIYKALKKTYVVGISPIIADAPVSGPAAKFMHALGHDVSCLGVAKMYANFLDKFIIDRKDNAYKNKIERLIPEVVVTNTNMNNIGEKKSLARTTLGEIL
ncbi:MAG: 2-phospho-L-lactate transferase [Methanobacterium sp.]|nr:2-phospho-L-lactate transferase [Methanobacterium sp.]